MLPRLWIVKMKRFLLIYILIHWVRVSSSVPTAKTWRANIFPVTLFNRIWNELQANLNTRVRLRIHVYKEVIATVHNFHQFEKVEWNKLVRAEIGARKYVLGQQRKSPSNERQTEIASPELSLEAHKYTAFSVRYLFNTKWMNHEECLQIIRTSTRARKYVMVQQGKSPSEGLTNLKMRRFHFFNENKS